MESSTQILKTRDQIRAAWQSGKRVLLVDGVLMRITRGKEGRLLASPASGAYSPRYSVEAKP